ncbi:unnamed protein product (macronuclear) [Paramecium tetraurelia]|uniref:Uncharacterized protein n=1 Tax=Paramecium tetraurelia TaxID=5888 RepID=A0EHG9_PARTE|nr:uncharacterized protein GSPATT00027084001 [Paramecium tetraurelia]CAK94760.1 unnamed protein product [Paramecium tetraurelia]|eukprot:XP_001462133.1 hypothetical protein (macronuclear) [Paramecium tetraurelia strain d4-2]
MYYERDFLGEGSYGKLYKGKDTKTQEEIAVKIFDLSKMEGVELELLETEIATMKDLQHPNIAKIIDSFKLPPKNMVIILELCDGDLNKLMKKYGGKLPESVAQVALTQLMEGFKYMINKNYIHRDVKPANALTKGSVYKVSDFGFAGKVNVRAKQKLDLFCGTPIYEAPQILAMIPYTAKCDLYSIGVMAYELVYGQFPWSNRAGDEQLLKNIKNVPLRFPVDIKVSEQYKDFLRRCLEYDENKRIEWDEAFNHPLFKVQESQKQYDSFKVPQNAKDLLGQLQKISQARDINVVELFEKYDTDRSLQLDRNEFYLFVLQLDPRLTRDQTTQIFKVMDRNGDELISLDEFKEIFCNYEFINISDKAERIIIDLREVVKARKLNLDQLFRSFDQQSDGKLNPQEFTQFIKQIAPGLKQDEIEEVFKKFDKNNDKEITFAEFKEQLVAGTQFDSKFDPEQERAMKLLSDLKRIVRTSGSNPQQIFNNFDKNRSGKLEFNEFQNICKIIDRNSTPDVEKVMFKLVNKSNSQGVSFQDFQQIFQ